MDDSIAKLEALAKKAVRFRCKPPILSPRAATYPEALRKAMGVIPPPDARFETTPIHVLRPPASQADLGILRKLLGRLGPPYEAFYSRHDGFQLYKDPLVDRCGIEAIKIKDWQKASDFMRGMVGKTPPENDPAHVYTGIAFATALQSGNFFVTPITGAMAGKVLYANHDDWNQNVFAGGFNEFLDRITEPPIELFSKLGGSMRYSDGKGCYQWIAEAVI